MVVRGLVRRVVRGVVRRVVRGVGSVGSPRSGGQFFQLSPSRLPSQLLIIVFTLGQIQDGCTTMEWRNCLVT